MRILKVYLDTSVISYLDQQDAPEKMLETQSLWRQLKSGKYAVVISDMVIQEINECQPEKRELLLSYLKQIDYSMIRLTDEIRTLADKILNMGILTKKSTDDAVHIASAISADCDIITSWNFKHIVNVRTIRGIRALSIMEGYRELLICSPPYFMESEEV